ncbi:motility associated factor glycosyltransferase family protein [Paenibacillus sp. strain BS8-2]
MTSLFDSNLFYLKEHQTNVFDEVMSYLSDSEHDPSFQLTTEHAVNIQYNTQQKSFLLYSKFDPQYECERWLEAYQFDDKIETDFVVYGLGLTYHLTQLINKYPQAKLFIYEPEIGIFVEALKVINAEELFTHKNIVNISIGKSKEVLNRYMHFLYYYAKFPLQVLDIPIYRTINTELFLVFLKLIEKITISKMVRRGFYERFGGQMFRNSLRNMIQMNNTPSLAILKGEFPGSTAIVVGGGPSLQYDIEQLKKMKDSCLIIAAGSSIQSLVHLGVEPHLIVSMDPGVVNLNVFTRNNVNHIPLLYMPQIHHQIIEVHNENNVFAYYSNDIIINKFVDSYEKDYTFEPTYSVTGTAIQAAIYLGASTVVFTGQDLSYPGGAMYSPGAKHLSNHTNRKSENQLSLEVDNVEGGKNPSTLSMKTTLENIQSIIEKFPNTTFINASSKGAVIKGADFMSLDQACKQYTGAMHDYGSIKSIISSAGIKGHPDFKDVRERTIEIVQAFEAFMKTCNVIGRDLDKLVELSSTNEAKAEKILRAIEEKWKPVIRHPIFKELVEEMMANEINVYDRKILDVFKETDMIKKSLLLQQTLGKFISDMKRRLDSLNQEYLALLNHVK